MDSVQWEFGQVGEDVEGFRASTADGAESEAPALHVGWILCANVERGA